MHIIDDSYQVCGDCLQWLVNGDASGLDYAYSEAEADARLADIQSAEQALAEEGLFAVSNDQSADEDFSTCACDHCGDSLAGARHNMALLRRD